jgi:hypothetical protein
MVMDVALMPGAEAVLAPPPPDEEDEEVEDPPPQAAATRATVHTTAAGVAHRLDPTRTRP